MNESKIEKEQLRIKAIELYNSSWKIPDICSTLNCTRSWFYKWLKRSQSNNPNWFKEQSRAPNTREKTTNNQMEQQILETRKQLISNPYMQYGPQAIYYTLELKGINPPPVWTIARILKRNNITHKKRSATYISKGKKYPYEYELCQQMDFVGPRYLYSKARYYFLNLICCDTHYAQVSALVNQSSINVCNSLIRFWKSAGIPDFLQMDNDLSYWGSLNKPNALGKVIRLCLLHGVTPVFIPVKEPWRNGIIEHFNNKMQSAVLNSGKFENVDGVQKASNYFGEIHNQYHHYSTQGGMTPNQRMKFLNYPATRLDSDYILSKRPLPLSEGEIHVIRFIRSDLRFNIFGLSFVLPDLTKYEYIKGVIITNEHRLIIFKEHEYITEYKFNLY